MEKYKQRSAFASLSDHLFRRLLALLAGVGWFCFLWGLSLPAIAAGLAMGGLIWLCARMLGKQTMQKKEALLRRMIGGELALERLLTASPRHAGFRTALWLTPKVPMEMQRALDWGVLGTLDKKPVLVRVIVRHKSMTIDVQQVIDVLRECRQVQRCFLCVTAPLSKEAEDYLQTALPPVRVVTRQELIALAGACSPATDEELSRLRRKKRTRHTPKEWAEIVFDPKRARRYFWYGAFMALLFRLTGQGYYPIPALLCLVLFLGCKWRERHRPAEAPW